MHEQYFSKADDARSIVDVLWLQYQKNPDRLAYRFISKPTDVYELTYGGLFENASALAMQLNDGHLMGKRVILAVSDNRHFVVSFFACLMSGAIAVPSPAVHKRRYLDQLYSRIEDCQACAIISDSDHAHDVFGESGIMVIDCRPCLKSTENVRSTEKWRPPGLSSNTLAFLQYTSGSTGDPKGVMISHGNIMANCKAIKTGMGIEEQTSSGMTVLPLYHDMGLIGGTLQPLFAGIEVTMMKPDALVQHPDWWLQLISRYGVTISGAPNFLFEYAAKVIRDDQLQDVDLSSWKVAYCGAEPIRASTLKLFAERFAPYGFGASSFFPCYGMAEATLFITGVPVDEDPKQYVINGSLPVISCGYPHHATSVKIVDPQTLLELSDEKKGEVWVKGDSVARGYWKKNELTRNVFQAYIANNEVDGPYLRTGDYGFLKDGELYITGRMKDIIIIRGRNYSPQDIEQVVASGHQAIQSLGCVAFSVEQEDREALVIIAEIRRSWVRRIDDIQVIEQAVRKSIHRVFQLSADDIVISRPYAIPRTSSGKLKRGQSRKDYMEGKMPIKRMA